MHHTESVEFSESYERGLKKIVQKVRKSQSERFNETARELGADESDDALDRVMGELDLKRRPEAQHASDCAAHNAPAYEAGACDCGAL